LTTIEIKNKKENMKYYSQIGQDKFVLDYFKNKANGVYIDIGAGDGEIFSNTLAMEELGWKGICIEPNSFQFEKLNKKRNDCFNCCVWKEETFVGFLEVSPCTDDEAIMLSGIEMTMDAEHITRLSKQADPDSIKCVVRRTITLNSVVHTLVDSGLHSIDYVSIDTEGSEFEILKAFDFDRYPVEVFTVENNYNEDGIRGFMDSKGYDLKKLSWDDVYIKRIEV